MNGQLYVLIVWAVSFFISGCAVSVFKGGD